MKEVEIRIGVHIDFIRPDEDLNFDGTKLDPMKSSFAVARSEF